MTRIRSILLVVLALSAVAAAVGWGYREGTRFGEGWSGLMPIWPIVAGGLVVVALLTGGLMWLAFYSSKHGYDEPYDVDKPNGGRRRRLEP